MRSTWKAAKSIPCEPVLLRCSSAVCSLGLHLQLACAGTCFHCRRDTIRVCHGGLACCWLAADPVGLLLSAFELTRRVVKNLTSGKLLLDSSDTAAYSAEFR